MFLPIGDMPNPRGTPVINYLLIGINITVFVLITLPMSMTRPDVNNPVLFEYIQAIPLYRNIPVSEMVNHISAYDLFVFTHGFKPAQPSMNDLFVSIFLHAGFLHLLGNMLFLWIYGDNVEHRLGSIVYLFLYLATGLMATLFYTLFQFHSTIPMIGASGAISGVLGFYFVWFPRNKVRVFLILFPFFMDVILLPARLVLGFYLIVDNLLPFLFASGGSGGVAHGAHIGGFVAGLVIAAAMDRFPDLISFAPWRRSWAAPTGRSFAKEHEKDTPLATEIHESLKGGDPLQAASSYFSARTTGARKTISPEDQLEIGFYLLRESRYSEALTLFRRYISDHPNGPFLDRAYLGAGVTLYQGKGQLTSAYQYFLAVPDLDPDPQIEVQARKYLASIQAMQKMQIRKK